MGSAEAKSLPSLAAEEARQYNGAKYRVALAFVVLELALLGVIAFTGWGAKLVRWVSLISPNSYYQALALFASIGLLATAIALPLRFYSEFVLEHRYGLSSLSVGRWFWRRSKELAVAVALGLPLALAFVLSLRRFGAWWWVPVGAVVFLLAVLLAHLGPVLLLPLFYKQERLDVPELNGRLQKLLHRAGLGLEGIYRINLSQETNKANAALAGLGWSRRVLLGDTLLQDLEPEEMEAVVTHEVGHHIHRHLAKMLAAGMAFTLVGLGSAAWLHAVWCEAHRLAVSDLRAMPVLLFAVVGLNFLLTPLENAFSRHLERQADHYALTSLEAPELYGRALAKLGRRNLADPNPPRWAVCLFYSHPPLRERIWKAEGWVRPAETDTPHTMMAGGGSLWRRFETGSLTRR